MTGNKSLRIFYLDVVSICQADTRFKLLLCITEQIIFTDTLSTHIHPHTSYLHGMQCSGCLQSQLHKNRWGGDSEQDNWHLNHSCMDCDIHG